MSHTRCVCIFSIYACSLSNLKLKILQILCLFEGKGFHIFSNLEVHGLSLVNYFILFKKTPNVGTKGKHQIWCNLNDIFEK